MLSPKKMKFFAGLAILTIAAACVSGIGQSHSRLCARYPDTAHPPVRYFDSDAETEMQQKDELLTVWEVECDIQP